VFTQRTTELGGHINSDGCALVSVAFAASVFLPQKRITPDFVNRVYKQALKDGSMGERAYIKDWQAVARLFGLTVDYLGHLAADWEPGDGEFAIVKWKLMIPHENIDWQHFTYGGNIRGHQFFDPWGSAAGSGWDTSRTVAQGVIEGTRGFRLA